MRTKLRTPRRQATLVTPKGANGMPANRKPVKNQGDPRGQFAAFLRSWIDRHDKGEQQLAKALHKSERTIRKWKEGTHGPAFEDLDAVALALGYADWAKLAAAITRFRESEKR